MNFTLNINKNNTAALETGSHTIELSPEYRLDKNTKFNKYIVRTGKAILTAYAIPNKAQSVKLAIIGQSRNANKLESVQSKNLIVKTGYIAIKGHTMKLS